jgi:hypothetical protein
MKKNQIAMAIGAIAMALSGAVYAGGPSVNLTNTGNINNTIATSAQANLGVPSTSYSSATGIASSTSNGQASFNNTPPAAGGLGANIALSGQTTDNNQGVVFNISTGGGTGTASSNGSSISSLDAAGTYSGSGNIGNGYGSTQTLTLGGSIGTPLNGGNGPSNGADGGQGTSIGIQATTNGGGAINASTASTFQVAGSVGASTTGADGTTGISVIGSVSDNKTSVSQVASTNTLTVNTGTDANPSSVQLTGGVSGNGSAGSSVNATGSFDDPAVSE